MIKNNLIAIIIHVIISIGMFSVSNEILFNNTIASVVVGLIISCFYIFIGYKIMSSTGSVIKDSLSVISVVVVGVLVWCVCYSTTQYGEMKDYDDYNGLLWVFYIIYVYPAYILTKPLQNISANISAADRKMYDIINIYLTLIPFFTYWIGILLKKFIRGIGKTSRG